MNEIIRAAESSGDERLFSAELFFVKYPLFALETKGLSKLQSFQEEFQTKTGTVKLKITTDPERGNFPGPFAKRVHRAVEKMISDRRRRTAGPVENPISFSGRELCQIMGITVSGHNIAAITGSLKAIVATTIEERICGKGSSVERYYHLFTRIVRRGETMPDGRIAHRNHLWLDEWYLDNLNEFYTVPLDSSFYQRLGSPYSMRLYEILTPRFYGLQRNNGAYVHLDYREEFCKLLPAKPQKYLSWAEAHFKVTHNELIQTGFLSAVEWEGKGREIKAVRYYPGSGALGERADKGKILGSVPEKTENFTGKEGTETFGRDDRRKDVSREMIQSDLFDQEEALVLDLEKRQIHNGRRLVAHSPHSLIAIRKAVMDYDEKIKNGYTFRETPQAWLVWAVRNEDYQPPDRYETKEEKELERKILKAERERRAEDDRREREEEERRRQELIDRQTKEREKKAQESPWKELWQEVLEKIEQRVRRESYKMWFETAFISEVTDEGVVVVDCNSEFAVNWMYEYYDRMVQEVWAEIKGETAKVEFACGMEARLEEAEEAEA